MLPADLLKVIIDAGELKIPDLLQYDPKIVAPLFDEALIERIETRLGIVVRPTAAAQYQPEAGQRRISSIDDGNDDSGFSHEQIAYLRRAYPAGAPFKDMLSEMQCNATQLLKFAHKMKFERPRLRAKPKKKYRDDFNIVAPAWRIRRLRLTLQECFDRGRLILDDGEDLTHRAMIRRFNMGRLSPKKLRGTHAHYSDKMKQHIVELHAAGYGNGAIASELDTRVDSIGKWLIANGLKSNYPFWSLEDDRTIITGIQQGMTIKEIQKFLPSRSVLAVKQRGYQLWPGRGFPLWTEEDSTALIEAYQKGDNIKQLAKSLGRTICSCRWRARYLGLVHPNSMNTEERMWSAEDDAILTKEYKNGTSACSIAKLIDRSPRSIYSRANKLGVKNPYHRLWSFQEIEKMRELIAAGLKVDEVARQLKRRSAAVYKCAAANGIVWPGPAGTRGAKRRTGGTDERYGRRTRGRHGDDGWRSQSRRRDESSSETEGS